MLKGDLVESCTMQEIPFSETEIHIFSRGSVPSEPLKLLRSKLFSLAPLLPKKNTKRKTGPNAISIARILLIHNKNLHT